MKPKYLRLLAFLVISIIIGAALSSVVLFTASKIIHNKQSNQIQLIKQFSYSNLGDNAKLLSKQLRAAVELDLLTITDNDENVLYRFIQPNNVTPFITTVLHALDLYTTSKTVNSTNGDLFIEFHSSYEEFLTPLSKLFIFMFFAPSIILIFGELFKLDLLNKKHLYTSAMFINEPEDQDKMDSTIPTTERDKLTGLPTGPEFIGYFEHLMQENELMQNGFFIMLRATQLQWLNLNLGYPAGDKYIQTIGTAIQKQTFDNLHIQTFKLNAFDFGILVPNVTLEESNTLLSKISNQFSATYFELDVPRELGFAIIAYDKNTSLTHLLSAADTIADKEMI